MSRHTRRDHVEYALARALEAAIVRLPDGAAAPVGQAIGGLVRRPFGIRRGTVRENIRRAFPDADDAWVDHTAREAYAHLGREVVAMIRLSRLNAEEVVALTDATGHQVKLRFDEQAPEAGAPLTGGADGGEESGAHRQLEVGVIHHDDGVVAAQFEDGTTEP